MPDNTSPPPGSDSPVSDIVERLDSLTGKQRVTLGDTVEAFGKRSFLPMMMVPALLVVSPLSGIPLFSSACGLTIAFIAGQMIARRDHLWLPDFLMNRGVEGKRAHEAVRRLRRFARWLDQHTHPRFGLLMHRPFRKSIQVMCFLCGAAMPFLEIVPFSSSILGATVLFLASALLARDGLFLLFGVATLVAAIVVPFWALGII